MTCAGRAEPQASRPWEKGALFPFCWPWRVKVLRGRSRHADGAAAWWVFSPSGARCFPHTSLRTGEPLAVAVMDSLRFAFLQPLGIVQTRQLRADLRRGPLPLWAGKALWSGQEAGAVSDTRGQCGWPSRQLDAPRGPACDRPCLPRPRWRPQLCSQQLAARPSREEHVPWSGRPPAHFWAQAERGSRAAGAEPGRPRQPPEKSPGGCAETGRILSAHE